MDILWHDIRYTLRSWRSYPSLFLIAVAALALGIGANTSIFSVVQTVLIQPLPYRDASRLVQIFAHSPKNGVKRYFVSTADYFDWQDRTHSLEAFASYFRNEMNVTETGSEPERVAGLMMTPGLVETLGMQLAAGRNMTAADGRQGGPLVALITTEFWRRRFAGDPNPIGRSIGLNGAPTTIIGILPPGVHFGGDAQVWNNLQLRRARPSPRFMEVVARLRAGCTVAHAQSEMNAIMRALGAEYPATNKDWEATVRTVPDDMFGNTRPALIVLFLSVSVLLLIACANVANLLLAQAASRRQEIAVRAALGASAIRLARQFLTESVLLSLTGGSVGLLLAKAGVQAVRHSGLTNVPRLQEVALNGPVLLYSFGLMLATGILFGLAPMWRIWKVELSGSLKEGGKASTGGAREQRVRDALVVAQVMLAVVLATSAGLLIKSFSRLTSVDPGFQTQHIVTANVSLPRAQHSQPQDISNAFDRLLAAFAGLPGVKAVGTTTSLPLEQDLDYRLPVRFLAMPAPRILEDQTAFHRMVSPGFFPAMGTPLIEGRFFSERDDLNSTAVAMINQTFSRRYWPRGSPLGQKVRTVSGGFGPLGWILMRDPQIVGVVADVKYTGLARAAEPAIYFPARQAPFYNISLVVRTDASLTPAALIPAIRQNVRDVDPNVPVAHIRTMSEEVASAVAQPRFQTILLASFSGLAILLGAVGIYGVLSYSVVRRTREIGIRAALGGRPSDIRRLILAHALKLVAFGVAPGALLTFAAGRFLESLLFEVKVTDVWTYCSVCGTFAVAGLLAGYLPARSAMKIEPGIALRMG